MYKLIFSPSDPTTNVSYLVCSLGHNSNFKEEADEITVKLSSRNKNTHQDQYSSSLCLKRVVGIA